MKLGLAVLLIALPLSAAEEELPAIEPIDIGLIEHTGTALLFLDVEAIDEQDRPMLGLKKEDFKIRLNYVWRKIYSVDDLCPCGEEELAGATGSPAPAHGAPPHFVLYFDYSQLGPRGREQALEQATRWAREVMQPGDRVMVVAYATDSGLVRLTDLTGDRAAVIRAIERGASMPELRDPFPGQIRERMEKCVTGTVGCYNVGRKEYFHARRSMETLLAFLTDLNEIPARKFVALFHENASIFPGRMYGEVPSYIPASIGEELRGYQDPYHERLSRSRSGRALVPDLLRLEERLGGAATASRAAVYPMLCGTTRTWTVNLGANLADQTGGDYNRHTGELATVLEQAGRRCPCIYRIGLQIQPKEKSFVLRTKVRVNGRSLPSRHRVEYLTEADRWMRKAQLVMSSPEQWRDLDVRSAVVPLRTTKHGWDVKVQVAVDITAISRSLEAEHDGEWEVAALLGGEAFKETWEMLGVYRVRPGERERVEGFVLYEREIEGLEPGRYELRAFVRDRETNRFGGTRFEIDLPASGAGGVAGPVMFDPDSTHVRSNLPLRTDKHPEPAFTPVARTGGIPLGQRVAVESGEPVQFLSWHCERATANIRSSVRRGPSAAWIKKPVELSRSGSCVVLSSVVETDRLPAGRYVYEVGQADETAPATTVFEVVEAEAMQAP